MINSVISTACEVIGGFIKIVSFGIIIAPEAILFWLFIKAIQPPTYQLSSLEKIALSFIRGKAHDSGKEKSFRKSRGYSFNVETGRVCVAESINFMSIFTAQ